MSEFTNVHLHTLVEPSPYHHNLPYILCFTNKTQKKQKKSQKLYLEKTLSTLFFPLECVRSSVNVTNKNTTVIL